MRLALGTVVFLLIRAALPAQTPTVTNVSGNSTQAGANINLTVTGTQFVTGAEVLWDGTALATAFGSDTQVTATVASAQTLIAGSHAVRVRNPGGETSGSVNYNLVNPAPTISSIEPTSAVVNSGSFNLTVNGTGFATASRVRWNGQNLAPPTSVSANQLIVPVDGFRLAAAATVQISVQNMAPGGGVSGTRNFQITNPTELRITTIRPETVFSGSPGIVVVVQGFGFIPASAVQWNGANLPTVFNGPNTLTAEVAAARLATAGGATVRVRNPDPGGQNSNGILFQIINSTPAISSLKPATVTAGSGAFKLDVTGTGFVSGSVIRWNGLSLMTTFVDRQNLSADIAAPLVEDAGQAVITVFSPMPGGGVTQPGATFTIGERFIVIQTPCPLAAGVAGETYRADLSASGGSPPYQWFLTAGALPPGLSLNRTNGRVTGTPTDIGAYSFTFEARDTKSLRQGRECRIQVNLPPLPALQITGLPQSGGAARQLGVGLRMDKAFPFPINGRMVLDFNSQTALPADDGAVRFRDGTNNAEFSIKAGDTRARFRSSESVVLQAGTVAGSTVLLVSTLTIRPPTSAPQTVPPSSPVTAIYTLASSAPVVTAAVIVERREASLLLRVTGISSTRRMDEIRVIYQRRGEGPEIPADVINAAAMFDTWYRSRVSEEFGSSFSVLLNVTPPVPLNQIDRLEIDLRNGQGRSDAFLLPL